MRIAANSVFKTSSNRFIVIVMLTSMSARPAVAADFVFFLIGEDDGESDDGDISRPTTNEKRWLHTHSLANVYLGL